MGIPWLIEELKFASLEPFFEPALRGVVEDGEAVEEGDPILGEGIEVLSKLPVRARCGGGDDEEGERGGQATAHPGTVDVSG